MAFFAGHDHVGGYADIDGRHFVTLEAMLEGAQCLSQPLQRVQHEMVPRLEDCCIFHKMFFLPQPRTAAMLMALWR